jgi:decaprenyl-phosphate phosphoribosyltransferase
MELKKLNKMNEFISLLRPKHWIKNLIIFFPSILASNILKQENWLLGIFGFVSFSFIASSGYIFNDIRDIERDRLHPFKKNRALASATIKIRHAFILALILIIFGFGLSFLLGLNSLGIIVLYFFVNWIYSIKIKSVRFLDIFVLTSFYIIRIVYGAVITNTEITGWFLVTILFACLSLSLNKRAMECLISTENKIPGRDYTKDDHTLLQFFSIIMGISSIIFFLIHSYFVLLINNPLFMVLIAFISIYLILVYFDTSKTKSDDPVDRILNNRIALVLIVVLILVYFFKFFFLNE